MTGFAGEAVLAAGGEVVRIAAAAVTGEAVIAICCEAGGKVVAEGAQNGSFSCGCLGNTQR